MSITSEPIDFEAIERIEKELKKNPNMTDDTAKLVKRSEKEVYEDIIKSGKNYDIEGGLKNLKKHINKEGDEKKNVGHW